MKFNIGKILLFIPSRKQKKKPISIPTLVNLPSLGTDAIQVSISKSRFILIIKLLLFPRSMLILVH
jgi:hypothetical protein